MKTIEQILNSEPVFLNDWAETKLFGLIAKFEDIPITEEEYEADKCPIPDKEYWLGKKIRMECSSPNWKNRKVLFATFTYQYYSGEAFVLFYENGELYEVNAVSSSIYGLDDQWIPERVILKELVNRLTLGKFGKEFNSELLKFLGVS